jgi:NADH-quinone oxidoreductase subunit K
MESIGLIHYMSLAGIVFVIGMSGMFLKRQNIIGVLMSIELMLLAVNINMVSIGVYVNNIDNQIFSIFILTVAAAEAAIGLSILVLYFKKSTNIELRSATKLHG